MKIKEFEQRLDKSDELTKELLLAIHGDESLNVEGLIPLVRKTGVKLDNAVVEISDLKKWRNLYEESRGMIQIKRSVLVQRILAGAGVVGIIVSAIIGITQIIDWMYKQGILTQ